MQKAQQTPPRRASPPSGATERKKILNSARTIALLPDRRDQAICLFFHEYATDVKGVYDYVPAVCSRASGASSCLYNAIELIGLGHLSGVHYGDPCLSQTELDVYKKHGSVLRAINNALRDPLLATTDETLVAIMLLGLFEVGHQTDQDPLFPADGYTSY